jgi:hypothetical protein
LTLKMKAAGSRKHW